MTLPAARTAQPGRNLWRSVGKLLRLRWVIFSSSFKRTSLRGKIASIVLWLLLLAGLVFAFVVSWLLLGLLRSPQLAAYGIDTSMLLNVLPPLVVSAAFIGVLLTSFGVLLQALYLAGDMEFLLSAPLPIRAVFLTKLIQAILPNFGLVLLFGLPVLYGLGASAGYNLLYYPMVFFMLLFLALAAAGMASLLVMLVVRIFPARRVAEMLGFLVAIIGFTCSQSGQIMNFSDVSSEQAVQTFNLVARLNSNWSPLAWAGRSLVDIGEGRLLIGFTLTLLTILLTGGIFALSLVTAERLYFSGWARVQVSVRSKKAARPVELDKVPGPLVGWLDKVSSAAVRAIIAKDFRMLRRELRNMSQLVTPLILGIMYAFILLRRGGEPPAGRGEAPQIFMDIMSNLMVYANVGISLFVGWSLLSRLALMGFSQEGKSYWMLKSAPVSTSKLIRAKFMVAYLPTLALGWGFLLIISLLQRTASFTLIFSMLVVALMIAGTAGINLAFGVLGANFNWEDPRRITQGRSGCLGSLASMIFLVVCFALFFGPTLLSGALNLPTAIGQSAGLLLGGAACLACTYIPLWMVRQRVALLDEN